jgi:hypothetical protein
MRLACKLLFQFRVIIGNSSGVFRKCEERYICINDIEKDIDNVNDAIEKVFSYARKMNRTYVNPAGNKVHFEFVGVLDFILLGVECDDIEFWYDYTVRKLPMENKKNSVMNKSDLKKKIKQYFIDSKQKKIVGDTTQSYKNIDIDLSISLRKR